MFAGTADKSFAPIGSNLPATSITTSVETAANRSRAEGISRLSRVPDSWVHAADRVRRVRDDAEAERRRSSALTACARRWARYR